MTAILFHCRKCGAQFPVNATMLPFACCGRRYGSLADIPKAHPSLVRKSANLLRDTAKHFKGGRRQVDDATRELRLGQCEACVLYFDREKQTCTHPECGCGMKKQRGVLDALGWASKACPIGRWHRPRFITNADLARDAMRLLGLAPPNLAGVVGVPRSGMVPAATIATAAHLPLFVLNEGGLHNTQGGYRTRAITGGGGPYLVVDDSSMYGGQMTRIKAQWEQHGGGHPAVFAAVYSAPLHYHRYGPMPELYVEEVDSPHIFEWNFFNNGYIKQTAYDFDGIICHDNIGTAQYLPRLWPVPLIVTGRLESGRADLGTWLAAHNITVNKIIMYPGTVEERDRPGELGRYKAYHFAQSGLTYFAESDPTQAREIAGLTGKMVVCPAIAKVF